MTKNISWLQSSAMAAAMALVMALLLSGCFHYTDTHPIHSTSVATVDSSKIGTASCRNIPILAFFYSKLNCSDAVKKAMQDGGITKVHHIEKTQAFTLLGLLGTKLTFTVYGE